MVKATATYEDVLVVYPKTLLDKHTRYRALNFIAKPIHIVWVCHDWCTHNPDGATLSSVGLVHV